MCSSDLLKKPPRGCTPSPSLKNETPEQGLNRLRHVLNLVCCLAMIDKGKLFQIPLEAALPREIRTTWPGEEGPETLVHWLMDASGKVLFLIDLATGRYIQVFFTKEEQALFNNFDEGDKATTINHFELLSELFGIVLMGPEHAGKIIDMINDNTAAENWTERSRHRLAKVDQVLSIMGLSELLLKQTVVGSRVKTKENFADTGTRMERGCDFRDGLAALEAKHGWVAVQVQVPDWLRQMGWDTLSKDLPSRDWYAQACSFLTWLETTHPGLVESQCGVPSARVLSALRSAFKDEPLPPALEVSSDFEVGTMSQVRRDTIARVPPTATQLQRKLDAYVGALGSTEGAQKFCSVNEHPPDSDPQEVIATMLQNQHEWFYNMVVQPNRDFDPTVVRAPPPKPKPWSPPTGHKCVAPVGMSTIFTGSGSMEESLVTALPDGEGVVVSGAEHHPTLRKHLKVRQPQAKVYSTAAEYLEHASAYMADILQSSPPCPSHSTANLYRRGNQDKFGGLHWEDTIKYVEVAKPGVVLLQCTGGVLRSVKGHPSPMTMLAKGVQSTYWITRLKLNAGTTCSPATGLTAPLNHERVHVILWRKSIFLRKPQVEHLANTATPHTSYRQFMDSLAEGREYRTMPD